MSNYLYLRLWCGFGWTREQVDALPEHVLDHALTLLAKEG